MWTQWVRLPCLAWALTLTVGQHLMATITHSVWAKDWTEWFPRLPRGQHCLLGGWGQEFPPGSAEKAHSSGVGVGAHPIEC